MPLKSLGYSRFALNDVIANEVGINDTELMFSLQFTMVTARWHSHSIYDERYIQSTLKR